MGDLASWIFAAPFLVTALLFGIGAAWANKKVER